MLYWDYNPGLAVLPTHYIATWTTITFRRYTNNLTKVSFPSTRIRTWNSRISSDIKDHRVILHNYEKPRNNCFFIHLIFLLIIQILSEIVLWIRERRRQSVWHQAKAVGGGQVVEFRTDQKFIRRSLNWKWKNYKFDEPSNRLRILMWL